MTESSELSRFVTDAAQLSGMRHATPEDWRAFGGRVALAAIVVAIVWTRSTPHALVLGAGLGPAVLMGMWLKVAKRSWPSRLLALGAGLAVAMLVLASVAGVAPPSSPLAYYAYPSADAVRFLKLGAWLACLPAPLMLAYATYLELARHIPGEFLPYVGGLLAAPVGIPIGIAALQGSGVEVDLMIKPLVVLFFVILAMGQGVRVGHILAELHGVAQEAGQCLQEQRTQRDPILRAGLTLPSVERVYQLLTQASHSDGQVDIDEREVLEAFRERFQLAPARANALEQDGAAAPLTLAGLPQAARDLLREGLAELVSRKSAASQGELQLLQLLA